MKKITWMCVAMAALVLQHGVAVATVTLVGTRVVYPMSAKFVDITAENSGKQSAQMIAWIDDGDINSTPDTASAPFLVAPAVKVLGPGRKQLLRIAYNGGSLPVDRESVYYLNITEIPPKSVGSQSMPVMQVAVRTRVKIFLRPTGLVGEPIAAARKLSWELIPNSDGARMRAKNPSPYFISMASIMLMRGDTMVADLDRGMVPPWGQAEFPLPTGAVDILGATAVNYVYVNDYGGGEAFTFTLPAR